MPVCCDISGTGKGSSFQLNKVLQVTLILPLTPTTTMRGVSLEAMAVFLLLFDESLERRRDSPRP
jgi:hypothetical protein